VQPKAENAIDAFVKDFQVRFNCGESIGKAVSKRLIRKG
jgi:hypothetical protein